MGEEAAALGTGTLLMASDDVLACPTSGVLTASGHTG